MTFYQVRVRGSDGGQNVINLLWYRDPSIFGTLGEYIGIANALSDAVYNQVVKSQTPAYPRGLGLLDAISSNYALQDIEVFAYNSLFAPISSTPVTNPYAGSGVRSAATNGPAPCINMRARMEPVLGPGIGTPKRGYLAIGPVADGDIDPTGHVTPAWIPFMDSLGDNLSTNVPIVLPLPTIFFPIRVRVTRLAGVVVAIGYRDVSDFVTDRVAKFRRSRLPEA